MQQIKDERRPEHGWMEERALRVRRLLQDHEGSGDVAAKTDLGPVVNPVTPIEMPGYERMRRRQRENQDL
jgi:hypothetical protein